MEHRHVSAYIEDGPHGGETLMINAEPDGSPPPEITLQDPPPTVPQFEEPSLRHSRQGVTSTYQLVDQHSREGNRYIYRLARRPQQRPVASPVDPGPA